MIDKLNAFFDSINLNSIELYSEFGLQHELCFFLRNKYPGLSIRLEYPVTKIFKQSTGFIKKEIDIYVTNNNDQKFVIELKMPKEDCGTPDVMYCAIEDVKFLEQLRQNKIDGCYSIFLTSKQAFWQAKRANAGIYELFNGQQVNIQSVNFTHLPKFLHKYGPIQLTNNYQAQWQKYTDLHKMDWRYYILEI